MIWLNRIHPLTQVVTRLWAILDISPHNEVKVNLTSVHKDAHVHACTYVNVHMFVDVISDVQRFFRNQHMYIAAYVLAMSVKSTHTHT